MLRYSNNLLAEISETWKLEAKQENNLRYFFHIDESKKVLNGERFYVIGRKGSGKSAIGEYILHLSNGEIQSGHNIFSEKLSFKNFPFNELYSLDNSKYTQPNQYITIWKYIIYSCICRLMAKNQNIHEEARSILERLYPPDPLKSLSRLIGQWTTKEFGAQILGTGGNIKVDKIASFKDLSWIDKTNILEDIIESYIDSSKYYIVFDELDEDYRVFGSSKELQQYINLITSLFKAVQDIKSIFRERNDVICPVVFLRDDIYRLIKDTDKNKWGDFKISLEWDTEKIKRMLSFRISKAIDEHGEVLPFPVAWEKVFKREKVLMGDGRNKPIDIFDYITLSTQLRPRDYIKYLQICAERTSAEGYPRITAKIVKSLDKAFSNYLRDEVVDEIHALLPDIENILSIISQIRKWNFSIQEFKKIYAEYHRNKTVTNGNIDYVLQTLFDFSVIGNRPKNRFVSFFKYVNPEARFNFQENIVIHRGLFKALQIL